MKSLRKILFNLDEVLIAFLIGAICVTLILQVFFRYALNSPLIWSEELARYLFVWAVMLGLGYNVRTETGISLSLLFLKFPRAVQMLLTCATNLFLCGIFGMCMPYAIRFTRMQASIHAAALDVPMSWIVVSIPIGFAYLILVLLYDSFRTVKRFRAAGRAEEKTA